MLSSANLKLILTMSKSGTVQKVQELMDPSLLCVIQAPFSSSHLK